MNKLTINGKETYALVYASELEDVSRKQINNVCNHPAFAQAKVRIMPDVHAGAGCVIGFTSTMENDCIIPNLIGVDIGCGVLTAKMSSSIELNEETLAGLDKKIRRNIPHGFGVRDKELAGLRNEFPELVEEIERITKDILKDNLSRHYRSLGTLGGGNHFIEISKDQDSGDHYLHVHSGSRHFGNKLAEIYQNLAIQTCDADVSDSLKYLTGELSNRYLRDMKVAQLFARVNRRLMIREILGEDSGDSFDTIHNYISDDGYMRKGAVSAHKDEKLIIPLNMRDGSLLCLGRGNEEYNFSAPHGAGRVYSRKKAKAELSLDEYEKEMEGIYTTSVSLSTLDEAPMAYKPMNHILEFLSPTADVVAHLKPVYNFKAP